MALGNAEELTADENRKVGTMRTEEKDALNQLRQELAKVEMLDTTGWTDGQLDQVEEQLRFMRGRIRQLEELAIAEFRGLDEETQCETAFALNELSVDELVKVPEEIVHAAAEAVEKREQRVRAYELKLAGKEQR